MTAYIAAYDVEHPECLAGVRTIVEIHHRMGVPATFFVVGKVLLKDAAQYRRLLDDPLFEVATHTWSHGMLREHPFCGPALSPEGVAEQIVRGKAAVEDVFARPCAGLRPGCGFADGFREAPEVLEVLSGSGLRYVSSLAWGPDWTLPAPLSQPFTYADDGFADLWELPCHGWHENLLKDHNRWGPRRLTLWPPLMPAAVPNGFLHSPEEEFEVNRVFLEAAADEGLTFVSLVWHPWSLHRFDPPMRMLELTFARVAELGLDAMTYAGLRDLVAGQR
ncbi:MAG: polysaccharide deacetylase family protein [Planctomycetota bacterium]|jgi:peptidoglycan/xylan/chitin deacetylase (PgdA/CDA1 family)